MPTAKNMDDLRKQIISRMEKALKVVQSKVEGDLYEETYGFYVGSKPKVYERTGALGDTPRTTAVSKNGNTVSFNAYLDQSHQYTSGDEPNMTQVLNLANYDEPWVTQGGAYARPTVGKKGFWERAEKKMQKTFDDTMSSYFN